MNTVQSIFRLFLFVAATLPVTLTSQSEEKLPGTVLKFQIAKMDVSSATGILGKVRTVEVALGTIVGQPGTFLFASIPLTKQTTLEVQLPAKRQKDENCGTQTFSGNSRSPKPFPARYNAVIFDQKDNKCPTVAAIESDWFVELSIQIPGVGQGELTATGDPRLYFHTESL